MPIGFSQASAEIERLEIAQRERAALWIRARWPDMLSNSTSFRGLQDAYVAGMADQKALMNGQLVERDSALLKLARIREITGEP